MKKLILTLTILCLCVFSLSAKDFVFALHDQESVAQLGYGGSYVTDNSTFYEIYSNPALLANSEKHTLLPSLDVRVAGPLEDALDLLQNISDVNQDNLLKLIKENNGLKLGMNLLPLLNFGHVSESGFAWGVANQIYVNAIVPSLLKTDLAVGYEGRFTFGYGFNLISTENHNLAIGATGKAFIQGQLSYNDSPLKIMDAFNSLKNLPLYVTPGFGFDIGLDYTFHNSLDVGLACKDIFTVAFIKNGGTKLDDLSKSTVGTPTILQPTIALGVGYNLPVDWTLGLISSFRVMANYNDLVTLFKPLARNPILEFSVGAEATLFHVISARIGLSEMYPAVGLGVRLGKFNMDFSMYGQELGLEPGSSPLMNAALSVGFYW